MVRTFLQYWHLFRVFQNVLSVWWTWSCLFGQCDDGEACVNFCEFSLFTFLVTQLPIFTCPWNADDLSLNIFFFFFTIHTHSGRFHSHSWFFIFLTWRSPSVFLGFPCGSAGKESACNAGDLGSIPGLGRSPGEGKGYPLQYSGLENSLDCTVHGVKKSQTQLSDFHFHFLHILGSQIVSSCPGVHRESSFHLAYPVWIFLTTWCGQNSSLSSFLCSLLLKVKKVHSLHFRISCLKWVV